MDIERLRALEKAVELVAKATPGSWAQEHRRGSDSSYRTEVFDEHGGAIATLTWHAKPPSYENGLKTTSTDRAENAEAIVAAVNFIREHGSDLIAELGHEVRAVEDERLCDFFADVGEVEQFMDDLCNVVTELTGDEGEDDPITVLRRYIASSPAHTSEARDVVDYQFEVWQDDECLAAGSAGTSHECGAESAHYAMMYGQDGPVTVRYFERREIKDAAMRQEAE